jgi:hypothetical protein
MKPMKKLQKYVMNFQEENLHNFLLESINSNSYF